jgi:hypothetical protein
MHPLHEHKLLGAYTVLSTPHHDSRGQSKRASPGSVPLPGSQSHGYGLALKFSILPSGSDPHTSPSPLAVLARWPQLGFLLFSEPPSPASWNLGRRHSPHSQQTLKCANRAERKATHWSSGTVSAPEINKAGGTTKAASASGPLGRYRLQQA